MGGSGVTNQDVYDHIITGFQTPQMTTTSADVEAAGSTVIVLDIDNIAVGDKLTLTNAAANVTETGTVKAVTASRRTRRATAGSVTLEEVLVNGFASGSSVSIISANSATFVKTLQAYFSNAPAYFDVSLLVSLINGGSPHPAGSCVDNCLLSDTDSENGNTCTTQLDLDFSEPATAIALLFDEDVAFNRIGRGSTFGCHSAAVCLCACDTDTWPALEEGVCSSTSSYEYHDGPAFGMLVFIVLVFFFGIFIYMLVQGCRKPAEESGEESAAAASMV